MRDAFPHGKYSLDIEPGEFSLRDYRAFLRGIEPEAAAFKRRQQAAFLAERERWAAAGQPEFVEPPDDVAGAGAGRRSRRVRGGALADDRERLAGGGRTRPARARPATSCVVLEAMKMEVAIVAPAEGVVEQVHCAQGAMVTAGQNLATLRVA